LIDLLVCAAHPDDAELYAGGTIIKMIESGADVAICDLTRGERGTRGSADLREQETAKATELMGLASDCRVNLSMPDGNIERTETNLLEVVRVIRRFVPRILLIPAPHDRHPDHEAAFRLCKEAWFNAGLTAVETVYESLMQDPWRPPLILSYSHGWEGTPDVVLDVSDQYERKLDAIAAYESQFRVPGREVQPSLKDPETHISSVDFMEFIIARHRRLGFMVGVTYGEGFNTLDGPVGIADLKHILPSEP
jgi:bacillithiol biosynthesis deacetylase BshB1